ncbi:MAG: hypothetical protein IRZ16_20190 [Myxococcaceae bacterium]|nr:hypothetical protein [Myxococcaceae bacterium]
MAAANAALLRTLNDLWRSRADASITIDSGRVHRTLHIHNGHFIGAESDVLTERLGVLLVAEGKLDVALVDPLVQAARTAGRFFGEQVVADGLLDETELNSALERQAHTRFDRSVQMSGKIEVRPLQRVRPQVRRALPAAVVASFRGRLPIEAATRLIASLPPSQTRLRPDAFTPEELELAGPELRYWRQLASGQDAAAVLDRAQDYETALRLIAALVGLGAIGGRMAEDEIAQFLRSA